MSKTELAKLVTEIIWSNFDAIQELYEADDKDGLEVEVYETIENVE